MIGVAANAANLETIEEFFELFKTPWEPAVPSREYQVVLDAGGRTDNLQAELVLVYGSGEEAIDRLAGVPVERVSGAVDLAWGETTLPIYGGVALLQRTPGMLVSGQKTADYSHRSGQRLVRRFGYDLCGEVRHLLAGHQSAARAAIPTLELHIDLLRRVLLESGVGFVEVLPRPERHDFICCLTHDVDFYGIRRHGFDRTLAGFVARASVGTLMDLSRQRRTLSEALRNWTALASLPFVHLGIAPDFWRPFEDYAGVESPRHSTFFLVPTKGQPGVAPGGGVETARAVPYEVSEIRTPATHAVARGSELAVHGIDAWRDADAGRRELQEITSVTTRPTAGVRMHWLYFDAGSPRMLEAAGFDYDSTYGFNDAVGYRAGTGQVFRLPGTERLLELPLSIMDSALFSGGRMALAADQARALTRQILANARQFGGTVVINWHGRSLAPERLWDTFYQTLLNELRKGGRVWFATATEAVDWFKWRRGIRFTRAADGDTTAIEVSAPGPHDHPGVIRLHTPGRTGARAKDFAFGGNTPLTIQTPQLQRTHG